MSNVSVEYYTSPLVVGADAFPRGIPFWGEASRRNRVLPKREESHEEWFVVSPLHKRSIEKRLPEPIMIDGELMGSMSVKGTRVDKLQLQVDNSSGSNATLQVFGLYKEGWGIGSKRTSDLLKRLGIRAERVVAVYNVDSQESIRRAREKFNTRKYIAGRIAEGIAKSITDKAYRNHFMRDLNLFLHAQTFINETKFGALVRVAPVPYRLEDLTYAKDMSIVTDTIAFLQKDPSYTRDIQSNPRAYLCEIVPELVGEQLGKLHALGYVHNFFGLHNVGLEGSMRDLDSVSTYPVNKANDLVYFIFHSDHGVLQKFSIPGVRPEKQQHETIHFLNHFFAEYIYARWGETSKTSLEDYLHIITDGVRSKNHALQVNRDRSVIAKTLSNSRGIIYTTEWIENYFAREKENISQLITAKQTQRKEEDVVEVGVELRS